MKVQCKTDTLVSIKKFFKIAIITGLVLLLTHACLTMLIGNVDYGQTLRTGYYKNDDGSTIIATSWAQLPVSSSLFHIAQEPTCPGFVGLFVSISHTIDYEYGMMAPTFAGDGLRINLDNFKVDSTGDIIPVWIGTAPEFNIRIDTVENRVIHMIEKEGQFGLHVPQQKGMIWPLTIYPSTSGFALKDELINMVAKARLYSW